MIELIERFESFTTSVTKAYKCIQKIKRAETERMGLKANHVMYMHIRINSDGRYVRN